MHHIDAISTGVGIGLALLAIAGILIYFDDAFRGRSHADVIFNPKPCAWCYMENELVQGEKVFCRECGHRADLAKESCDCWMCALKHELLNTAEKVPA